MTQESDLNEILSFYNSYDRNKDGLISFAEFDRLITALGGNSTTEQRRSGFSSIDKDNNGYIDFSEFAEWWGNN